jgi:hypothetical protein
VRFLSQPTTPVLPATTWSNGDKKTGDGMLADEKPFLLRDFFNTHA